MPEDFWPRRLDAAECEIIGVFPPFRVGERVIEIDGPQHGVGVVRECFRVGETWTARIELLTGPFVAVETYAPADGYVQCPAGWQDAPQPRRLAEEDARLFAWERDDRGVVEDARQSDIRMGRHAERAKFLRAELAPWWRDYGSLINPTLAAEQAANCLAQAVMLAAEACGRSAA